MSQIRLKSSFQKTAIIFVPLLMFDRCLQIDLRKPEKRRKYELRSKYFTLTCFIQSFEACGL